MENQSLREELRQRLGNTLPSELNTDFTLDRWLHNYQHQLDECVEKFNEYLHNRKALGYDRPESLDRFYSRPDVANFHKIFSLSKLDNKWINDLDNGIVFVEMGVAEPSKVVKAMRVAEYANIFFGYCEYFQRMVIEHERKSGKRSYGICIFDMKLMSFIEYVNPMAAINRLFEARVNIWMEYYGELLKRVVIVNPPRLLGAVFTVMSVLLPSRLLERFSFAHKQPEDLEVFISKTAIPSAYGGQKLIDGSDLLPNGCNAPKEIGKKDYLTEGLVWRDFSSVRYEEHFIKVGSSFCREMEAKKGQKLCYEYLTNREYQIFLIKDGVEYLLPCFKMTTPTLSEEGSIPIAENCHLKLEIKNISKLMKMKLKVAVHLFD